MQKRAVERRLSGVAGFADPRAELEQYPTPPDVAAQLVHVAAMRGDLDDWIVDLGAGTGPLALAAACHEPAGVVGLERDPSALAVARENERRVEPPVGVRWVTGDATRAPLVARSGRRVTIVSNPPFGAQDGARGADRAFLETAAAVADVSYTLHNGGSRSFVESFAADNGGRVTDAFAVAFELDRQFDHHTSEQVTIDAEAYRIAWE